MRDHEIPRPPQHVSHVALDVRPRPLGRQEVTRHGVVSQRPEGVPDGAAELAGDENFHPNISLISFSRRHRSPVRPLLVRYHHQALDLVPVVLLDLFQSLPRNVLPEPVLVAHQALDDLPLKPVNVYGRTKLMVEDILRDLKSADPAWRIALLRYFNPVGAHESGMIGEDPSGIPNNLMPFIAQVAVGKREKLAVFGNDYPTPDGTGVRDYIHVDDLAQGHLAAINALNQNPGLITVNLGTGQGYSVLDMIQAFEKASGKTIAYDIVARRPGDIAACYADPTRAKTLLGWQAQHGIDRMCADAWRWQSTSATTAVLV